jgi:hypothetical protein
MADDNLILEHLRRIRDELRDVRETQADHTARFQRLEEAFARTRRDQAADAERR